MSITVYSVTFEWWHIALGVTIAAAYAVPVFCGVPFVKTLLLGLGWQMFLLTLVSILAPRSRS